MAAHEPDLELTVAIPTCNGAAHLAETIKSILAQERVRFDLIISDDRSDDNTIDVVRAVAGERARVEINSERLGLAGNWNQCAALARTALLAIFHQDDVMLPGHLAAHVAAFVADRSVGLTASASVVIDENGKAVPRELIEQGGAGPIDHVFATGQFARVMASGNPLRCSAVTVRTEALRAAGGFDDRLRYVVDWDCWLRLSRNWSVSWLTQPTVQIRWHSASETHRFKAGLADLDETGDMLRTLFERDLKDVPDIASLRAAAQHRLARAFLNRAHDALRLGMPDVARNALLKGLEYSPRLIKTILADPRLSVSMAALALAPGIAARVFARRNN